MSEYSKWPFSKIDLPSENFTRPFVLELEKLAQEGDHESQFKIGYCYQYGLCVRTNLNKAFDWYTQAAEAYIPGALCNLGGFYFLGIATKENIPMGFELYKKAAELGDVIAQAILAQLYMEIFNNTEAAIYWWEYAAEQNHPDSITWLASAYKKGIGHIERDYQKARELYERAAKLGSSIASDNLGSFYLEGLGVSKSVSQARYWFQKGSEQGSPHAKYHLAVLYWNDPYYTNRLSSENYTSSFVKTGTLLLNGPYYTNRLSSRNYIADAIKTRIKAIQLLKEAAKEDITPAIDLLMDIYNGNNLERNYVDIKWLQKIIRKNKKRKYYSTPGFIYESPHGGRFYIDD